ncbi:hypothetical protein ACFVMC_29925 [Nocardia sp. NPDC127579]|uniref:hypothetical protein n=1 Tax=Nocardia sp. NPDC127579 TaxID=3345402 RepID=UPI00363D3338
MTARAELERELGGPIEALDLLSDAEIRELLMTFRTARRIESDMLGESVDSVVGTLPWPLRRPAKKIMFGNRLGR